MLVVNPREQRGGRMDVIILPFPVLTLTGDGATTGIIWADTADHSVIFPFNFRINPLTPINYRVSSMIKDAPYTPLWLLNIILVNAAEAELCKAGQFGIGGSVRAGYSEPFSYVGTDAPQYGNGIKINLAWNGAAPPRGSCTVVLPAKIKLMLDAGNRA